jgi:hypothetical protein
MPWLAFMQERKHSFGVLYLSWPKMAAMIEAEAMWFGVTFPTMRLPLF